MERISVNKVSSGSTINKGSGFNNLCSIEQLNRNMHDFFIWKSYNYTVHSVERVYVTLGLGRDKHRPSEVKGSSHTGLLVTRTHTRTSW